MTTSPTDTLYFKSGYSTVNGMEMYYEIHGQGKPLVLIHGGGSTIGTSFGRIIPQLALNRQLICVELQAHGRTGDRNKSISFEQDADDVAALLKNLQISQADFLVSAMEGQPLCKSLSGIPNYPIRSSQPHPYSNVTEHRLSSGNS